MSARRRLRGGFVPLRHQLTATECGAACLAMVVSHHGRSTAVSECREILGVGRDGVSARQIAEAATALGMVAEAVVRPDPYAEPLDGPAIAFVSGNHFVVVERVGQRLVRIVDPSAGRELLTREEFRERYSGVMVLLSPGPDFQPRRVRWRDSAVRRYLHDFVLTRGSRRLLVGVLAAAALLQGLGLALPAVTQFAVDRMVPYGRDDLLGLLAAGVAGTALLYGLLTLLRTRLLLAVRVRADRLLTTRFVGHLLRLPLSYFLQRSRGDLLMRLNSLSGTREQLTQQGLTLLLDIAVLVGYAAALTLWAPQYLPVVALLGVGQLVVMLLSYRRLRMLARREMQAKAEENGFLVEALEAMTPVKANGIEDHTNTRWRGLFETFQQTMLRFGKVNAWVETVEGALRTLAPLALLWFGLSLVLRGDLTLGTMLAANTLSLSLLAPVQGLVGTIQFFAVLRAQLERIYDVFDSAVEKSGTVVLPSDEPAALEVEGVTFRYHPHGPAVLSDVSFTVAPSSKLGIVGRTGSGKSTLALLLLGLLPLQEGGIRHNGVPIGELDLVAFRRRCGVVLQQLTLFNGSIRDNLVLGRTDITDDDVAEAARIAGLHDDVMALPMRYHTNVGEAGAALSAGQRQRVTLARALLHRPRLLVLDEATSHLDPKTERQVDEALSELRVTRIVISHRVNAIRNADRILVLDRGRLVATGRHEELLAAGGVYRDLFGTPDRPATARPVNGVTPRITVHKSTAHNGAVQPTGSDLTHVDGRV